MIGRGTVAASMLLAAMATAGPVQAQGAGSGTASRLPRGDYETHWRQSGGDWRSQVTRTTFAGCAYPADTACGKPAKGRYRAGASVPYNAFGCTRPAITVQCVVQKAGLGMPDATDARDTRPPATGFTSGRYVLKTSAYSAVVDLTFTGDRFRGVSDWSLPSAHRDPIVHGRITDGSISFTRLCRGRRDCVQKFAGTVTGNRASGLWAGPGLGAERFRSWMLQPE